METVLITGCAGFIGGYMVHKYAKTGNINVVGTYAINKFSVPDLNVEKYNKNYNNCHLYQCDIRQRSEMRKIIREHMPSIIYHLAAQSHPTVSIDAPVETIDTNVIGTINLFEIIREIRETCDYDPMVVVACSSAEYGEAMNILTSINNTYAYGVPESVPLKPLHPYGVSKVAQDMLSYYYFKQYGIRCIRARLCNTTGPGKTGDVLSDLIIRITRINHGDIDKLHVGNLESKRAILDVHDTVNALELLAHKGVAGEVYNVCAKDTYSVKQLIIAIENIARRKYSIEIDSELVRTNDEYVIKCDTTKLEVDTGWKPQISLQLTLQKMYDFWESLWQNGELEE